MLSSEDKVTLERGTGAKLTMGMDRSGPLGGLFRPDNYVFGQSCVLTTFLFLAEACSDCFLSIIQWCRVGNVAGDGLNWSDADS